MPTRRVNLSERDDQFVQLVIAAGEYENVSEVVQAALRVLDRDRRWTESRLADLRAQIETSLKQLERDEGITVELDALSDLLRQIDDDAAQIVTESG